MEYYIYLQLIVFSSTAIESVYEEKALNLFLIGCKIKAESQPAIVEQIIRAQFSAANHKVQITVGLPNACYGFIFTSLCQLCRDLHL